MAGDEKAAARADLEKALHLDKLTRSERAAYRRLLHGDAPATARTEPRHREHGDGRARG